MTRWRNCFHRTPRHIPFCHPTRTCSLAVFTERMLSTCIGACAGRQSIARHRSDHKLLIHCRTKLDRRASFPVLPPPEQSCARTSATPAFSLACAAGLGKRRGVAARPPAGVGHRPRARSLRLVAGRYVRKPAHTLRVATAVGVDRAHARVRRVVLRCRPTSTRGAGPPTLNACFQPERTARVGRGRVGALLYL